MAVNGDEAIGLRRSKRKEEESVRDADGDDAERNAG
jgi:hypothetical protein